MHLRRIVLGAAVVLALVCFPGPAAAAPAYVQSVAAAQPSTVCGYSDHAREQMRIRGISPLDVQLAVGLGANDAFLNRHGNWQYESNGLMVVMNDAGCVVTAMTR